MECNQQEKCKAMQSAALRVLTKNLKKERAAERFNECRNVMMEIDKEISVYECKAVRLLKERIESYFNAQYLPQRKRIIDMFLTELEAFMKE